jgi:hypothetical protein
MRSNGDSVSKIRLKQWTNVELKQSVGHCLAGPYIVRLSHTLSDLAIHCSAGGLWKLNLQVGHCLVQAEHCPVGPYNVRYEVSGNTFFSQNPPLSFQTWFLSYGAPNQMKLGHKDHLNTRNKFLKEVFSKSNDFPSDFGWTQKLRFWGNDEKSMKSKGLEPWIHSKIGGRW